MFMITGSSKRMSVVVLCFALVASAAGIRARADAPCALIPMQGQGGEVAQHGRGGRSLPDLGGWWSAVQSEYRTPPHFEGLRFPGVNGELLGKVGFMVTADSVSILNGRGIVRHLDIGEDPLMGEHPREPESATYLAYWEVDTLVVKTREDESSPGSVRVTERISLLDRNTLEYALHVIAPDHPTKPLEIRMLFRRDQRPAGMSIPTSF